MTLPEPSSSPERRPESGLDVSVPHRAGAIVTEFISSIVGEAQARADQIVVAAGEEAGPQREAALAAAARVRECHDALADALAGLRNDLRREADWLYADPRISAHVHQPAEATPAALTIRAEVAAPDAPEEAAPDAPEEAAPDAPEEAAPDAPEEAAPDAPLVAATDEEADPTEVVEVVHGEVEEDPGGDVAGRQSSDAVPAVQELVRRVERMSDEELARAYANAVKAAARDADSAQADSMRRLADAALQDALRRPAFTQERPTPRARRPFFRSRRRTETPLDELRDACRRSLAR